MIVKIEISWISNEKCNASPVIKINPSPALKVCWWRPVLVSKTLIVERGRKLWNLVLQFNQLLVKYLLYQIILWYVSQSESSGFVVVFQSITSNQKISSGLGIFTSFSEFFFQYGYCYLWKSQYFHLNNIS